ncbi:hypothetical protein BG53_14855 [Paenibacillus darwinianus]|uniref:HTH LytTR-type domain-containing protein n=1 Tax=Paenibacillus darwinianus TaxID=1380763 RepID=A0A9W5S252_9BACL|nr:LytTR family DNA-binding domain-containing protein [Paenibacillus darwinianus]EXX86021.1 hypothetical protein BG52_07375 [Paenibacillus darwinianus]EXX88792.1 hypothetical protein CH50_02790 [Paenibacillus darwinianus]EXX89772.1 hypothetical protein BG53_14855 [Paenibacillus darwinianus]
MYVSVTRSVEGIGMESIHVDDILFLETSQSRILVHTKDGVYYVPNTLERWMRAFGSIGQQFEMVDRCSIANLNRVRRIDPVWCRLYFDDNPSEGAKPCNVARSHYRKVANKIEEIRKA